MRDVVFSFKAKKRTAAYSRFAKNNITVIAEAWCNLGKAAANILVAVFQKIQIYGHKKSPLNGQLTGVLRQ